MHYLYRMLIVLSLALCWATAYAEPADYSPHSDTLQHSPTATTPRQLGEVLIYGARRLTTSVPLQRLSGESLHALSSHSVADALRLFSGVQIKDYGGMGGLKTIDVRNMGSHHVGVNYDGLQLGNAQNGVIDLGRFSTEDLEEISLYNGQRTDGLLPARDYASASAIYLRSKVPTFADNERTHLLLRYKLGSIQLINPSLRWEQKLSNGWSLSTSAAYLYSDGAYRFRYRRLTAQGAVAYDTMAYRRNSDIRSTRAELGLYGTIGGGRLQLKLYGYASERGLPGAIVKNIWHTGERQGDRDAFAQLSYERSWSPRYESKFNAKFAYDRTHYRSEERSDFLGQEVATRAFANNRYYQQELYLSSSHRYHLSPSLHLSAAIDYQYNHLQASRATDTTPFATPSRSVIYTSLASTYLRGPWELSASLLGVGTIESARHGAQAPDKRYLSPSASASYTPQALGGLSLRALYKRALRLPTFNDMYYTQIGYSNLKTEHSDQLGLGAIYQPHTQGWCRQIYLKADLYYALIRDKIIAAPTGSSFRWMMSNMGQVRSWGIETSALCSAHWGDLKARLQLSYAYTRAQDFTKIQGTPLSSYGDQIPYTPWHSGSAVAAAEYRRWSLNYSFIYVGARYNSAVNNIPRNRVQPWYTHDLSLCRSYSVLGHTLRTTLEVNNLLNQYYDIVLGYPMPGRNARLSIELTL